MRNVGWDVETHLITIHDPHPPLVCLTLSGHKDTEDLYLKALKVCPNARHEVSPTGDWGVLVNRSDAKVLSLFAAIPDVRLIAHNGGFDWSVWIRYMREEGYDKLALRKLALDMAETGRIADTLIREKLLCIANGNFAYDSRRNLGYKKDGTKRVGKTKFNLGYCVGTHFGEAAEAALDAEKTDPDGWRLRYKELQDIPVLDWPERAADYAIQDAVWAVKLYEKQAALGPLEYRPGLNVRADGTIVNEVEQTAITLPLAWLGSTGFKTDPEEVKKVEKATHLEVKKGEGLALKMGMIRKNGCLTCGGTGYTAIGVACPTCKAQSCPRLDGQAAGKCQVCQRRKKTCLAGTPKFGSRDNKRFQEIVRVAYEEGDDPEKAPRTKTGAISTDKDALKGSGSPVLLAYGGTLFAKRMLNRYIPDLHAGAVDRIREPPNSLVRTGRTSWKHQQPPRKGGFRECVIPDAGNVFASIDYSSVELGALAQICLQFVGYSKLAVAINKGIDPHLLFGLRLLAMDGTNLTYEEGAAIKKDEKHPRHDLIMAFRQRAKAANFGFPGGMGWRKFIAYALGYDVVLTQAQARELRDMYLDMWSEVREYLKLIGEMAEFGPFHIKQLASGRIRHVEYYASGANTYFQGLAADGLKAAFWQLTREMYTEPESPLFGVRAWGYVHDEVLFEGPGETCHLWAPHASRIMVDHMKKHTPDILVQAEPALMRRWYKQAAPVYDDRGKLLVWEIK